MASRGVPVTITGLLVVSVKSSVAADAAVLIT